MNLFLNIKTLPTQFMLLAFDIRHPFKSIASTVKDWAKQTAGRAASDVANEVLESIGNALSDFINDAFEGISVTFSAARPSLDVWNSYLSEDVSKNIELFTQYFAVTLLIIILVLSLLKMIINPQEMTQTPLMLLGKTAVAVSLIYCSPQIIRTVFEITDKLYESAYGSTEHIFDLTNLLGVETVEKSVSILGIGLASLALPPLIFFVLVIALIVSWPVIREFFKYVLETFERYIICVIVALFAPAAFATLISKDTENIFKSWCRTFGAQLFLLYINGIFIRGALYLAVDASINTKGILGYLFLLGYLRACQRLDAILQSMGINIAQCAGGIMDSLSGAARSLGNVNHNREKAGNTLKAIGAATGNMGMFDIGSKIGVGANSVAQAGLPTQANIAADFVNQRARMGLATTAEQLNTNKPVASQAKQAANASKQQFVNPTPKTPVGKAAAAFKENTKAHISPSANKGSNFNTNAANVVSRCMMNPNANRSLWSGLDQNLVNSGIADMVKGTNLSNINSGEISYGGVASFKATGSDGIERDYRMSSTPSASALSLEDSNGDATGFYLNSRSEMENGQVVTGDGIFQDTGALGYEAALSDMNIDSASFDNGVTTFMSGSDNIASMDKSGNLLMGNEVASNDMCAQLNDDVMHLFPGATFKEDKDGKQIGFKISGNTVSADIKMPGSDNYRTVYASDAVKQNTTLPTEIGSRKSITHKNEDGTKYKTIFTVSKQPNRTKKTEENANSKNRKGQ